MSSLCWPMWVLLSSIRVEKSSLVSVYSSLFCWISFLVNIISLSVWSLNFLSSRLSCSISAKIFSMLSSAVQTRSWTSDLLLTTVNILKSCLNEYMRFWCLLLCSNSDCSGCKFCWSSSFSSSVPLVYKTISMHDPNVSLQSFSSSLVASLVNSSYVALKASVFLSSAVTLFLISSFSLRSVSRPVLAFWFVT